MLVPAKCTECNASVQVDSTKEASICDYCGTPFITKTAIASNNVVAGNVNAQVVNIYNVVSPPEQGLPPRPTPQPIFALWSNGYYYPGYVSEDLGGQARVSFCDGDVSVVAKEHIMDLDKAFQTLTIQGNWGYGGIFYKAKVLSQQPLTVKYTYDGIVEQVELVQLRGKAKGLFR